jgi:hypothetical protein
MYVVRARDLLQARRIEATLFVRAIIEAAAICQFVQLAMTTVHGAHKEI